MGCGLVDDEFRARSTHFRYHLTINTTFSPLIPRSYRPTPVAIRDDDVGIGAGNNCYIDPASQRTKSNAYFGEARERRS